MKKIIKKIVSYQCDVCKTEYKTPSEAIECEKMPVEPLKFKIGDRVEAIQPCICSDEDKEYILKGEIVEIIGPKPADEEYERKWLGGKPERLESHVGRYKIEYICPFCGIEAMAVYYAPEIKLSEKNKGF